MKRFERLLAWVYMIGCCVCTCTAPGESATPFLTSSAEFEYAHYLLKSADLARDAGDHATATIYYEEAAREYTSLAEKHPTMDHDMSSSLAAYCGRELALITSIAGQPQSRANGVASTETDDTVLQVDYPAAKHVASEGIRADAVELIKQGRSKEAREILIGALKQEPDDIELRMLIATAQCQQGQFGDAVFVLEQLVEDSPSNANAHLMLGTAYFGVGDFPAARRGIERAITIDPGSREAHYDLARLLVTINSEDRDLAQHHYRQAIELGGNVDESLEAMFNVEWSREPDLMLIDPHAQPSQYNTQASP